MARGFDDRLDRALATWTEWPLALTAPPVPISRVPGGRTNTNFRLKAPGLGSDLQLRLNHPDPGRLGIDRDLERDILRATADADLSKPVRHWDPAGHFVLFPWIDARPWTRADLDSPEQRERLWPLVERLADIDIDRPRRRYTDYLDHYWHQLERAGRIEPRLRERREEFRTRLVAFDAAPWSAGLTHHDLIPANILDTSDRLYLIDWEYAAVGHPDIDRWAIDRRSAHDPLVVELMTWINDLWELLRVAP